MQKLIPIEAVEREKAIKQINLALAEARRPEAKAGELFGADWCHFQRFGLFKKPIPCHLMLTRTRLLVMCEFEDILKWMDVPMIRPNMRHRNPIGADLAEFMGREGAGDREIGDSWTAEELYEFAEARITKLLNYLYAREFNRLVGWSKPKAQVAVTASA